MCYRKYEKAYTCVLISFNKMFFYYDIKYNPMIRRNYLLHYHTVFVLTVMSYAWYFDYCIYKVITARDWINKKCCKICWFKSCAVLMKIFIRMMFTCLDFIWLTSKPIFLQCCAVYKESFIFINFCGTLRLLCPLYGILDRFSVPLLYCPFFFYLKVVTDNCIKKIQ